MAPRKQKVAEPDMPFDTCGDCYFCHRVEMHGDPHWCFAEPPYPVEGDSPSSMRGALTKAEAPCCQLFKPKKVH